MKTRETLITNYIDAYNTFDSEKMVADFDETIKFENISATETTLSLVGLASFKEQAKQATAFFATRKQTVTAYKHTELETEVEITYHAVLAIDLPNGLKKGDELNLKGKSIFKFLGNKISELIDIS